MRRQHGVPLFLAAGSSRAIPLSRLGLAAGPDAVSEAHIQALVHDHPECLPISEVDAMFAGPVAICTELNTPAGSIDNFMLTPSGLPVLVECKLWRNPEGRREVVGQILDYAKALSLWSSSDLQREVSRRLNKPGNPLLDLMRAASPDFDEMQFNDALTANLRRGRFLLLIVGDGIREGVEAISDYLQRHAGLHFSFGLVELPIYLMSDGGRLVAPRVVVKTTVVVRNVVAAPDGYSVEEPRDANDVDAADPERTALADAQQQFWKAFLDQLKLDDPEQPIPNPARQGYLGFSMPAPGGSSWLTVYRDSRKNEVGVFLSSHRDGPGDYAMRTISDDWDAVGPQLGGTARRDLTKPDRPRMVDSRTFGALEQPEARRQAFEWLAERVNAFVNVMRPRVRAAAADYAEQRN